MNRKWFDFILMRLLVAFIYGVLVFTIITDLHSLTDLKTITIVFAITFYILSTIDMFQHNIKEIKKVKVLTAIDELYSWSTDSGIDPTTALETVKIIEDYIGVRI